MENASKEEEGANAIENMSELDFLFAMINRGMNLVVGDGGIEMNQDLDTSDNQEGEKRREEGPRVRLEGTPAWVHIEAPPFLLFLRNFLRYWNEPKYG